MTVLLIASLIAFIVLMVALAVGPQTDDLRVFEWHHGYLGGILIAAGIVVWQVWPDAWRWFAELLTLAGLLFLAEDAGQHAAQRWSRSATINHRSAFWHFWQDVNS